MSCRGREELRQGQSQPVEVPGRVPTRATWENGAVPTKAVVLEGDFAVVR